MRLRFLLLCKSGAKICPFWERPSCLCYVIWSQSLHSIVRRQDDGPQNMPPQSFHCLTEVSERLSQLSVMMSDPHLWEKFVWHVLWFFSLAHVPSTNMERTGLMTYTAASHQGALKMFWLHFWRAVMTSIFIYSQCSNQTQFKLFTCPPLSLTVSFRW